MVGIWKYVKARNFTDAADALLSIPKLDSNQKLPRNVYTAVLSICRTKDQFPACLRILQELKTAGYTAVEPDYLAIIRCLSHSPVDVSDNSKDIQRSLAVLKYMQVVGEQPRSRTYMPILAAMNKQRDLRGLVQLVSEMYSKGLEVRRNAIALLLDTYALCYSLGSTTSSADATAPAGQSDGTHQVTLQMLQDLLYKCNNKDPTGISGADMIKIVESFTLLEPSVSAGAEAETLTLAETSPILASIRARGVLTSDNIEPDTISTEYTGSEINISAQADCTGKGRSTKKDKDNRLRIHDVLPIKDNHYYPIPYLFGNPNSRGYSSSDGNEDRSGGGSGDARFYDASREEGVGHTSHISDELVAETFSKLTAISSSAAVVGSSATVDADVTSTDRAKEVTNGSTTCVSRYPDDPARIVHIDALSGVCPNCGTQLRNHVLSEDLLHRIRAALTRTVIASGYDHYRELQKFISWLDERPHFDIVIDGANVAYHRQKEIARGFSYRQLLFVVQEVMKKHPDKRVLVVVPRGHYSKITDVHRHSAYSHNEFVRSKECYNTFETWREQGILYTVPRGIEDDWFWLMASIATRRSGSDHTCISEDESVDNNENSATTSDNSTAAVPVRNCGYVLTNDGMRDHKVVFLEPKYFTRWRSTLTIQFDISRPISDDLTSDAIVWPKLKFWEPGFHSREMQMRLPDKGNENDEDMDENSVGVGARWHVPATDQNAWLCMNINASGKMSD